MASVDNNMHIEGNGAMGVDGNMNVNAAGNNVSVTQSSVLSPVLPYENECVASTGNGSSGNLP